MKRLRELLGTYERHISAAAIVVAFIVDSITLTRIDDHLATALITLYLVIVGVGIIAINLFEAGRLPRISARLYPWITIAVQFSFGGLFGRFLIYYARSGSLAASWPFLVILAGLLVGNEFAKKYYARLALQIGFFFLALFSFLIFYVPVLLGQMGADIFLLSGLTSLVAISCFLSLLLRLIPERIEQRKRLLTITIGVLFLLVNTLYFTNSIPPLPLSLRDAGVYHTVTRTSSGYKATREKVAPFAFLHQYETVHLTANEPITAYTAIFAPTDFGTSIAHVWQTYNAQRGKWLDTSTITFPIEGGSDRGYRGYSIKTNVTAGLWRVNVETTRGELLGRIYIQIEIVDHTPQLESEQL